MEKIKSYLCSTPPHIYFILFFLIQQKIFQFIFFYSICVSDGMKNEMKKIWKRILDMYRMLNFVLKKIFFFFFSPTRSRLWPDPCRKCKSKCVNELVSCNCIKLTVTWSRINHQFLWQKKNKKMNFKIITSDTLPRSPLNTIGTFFFLWFWV